MGEEDRVHPAAILGAARYAIALDKDLTEQRKRVGYDADYWLSREIEAVDKAEQQFGELLSRYIQQEAREMVKEILRDLNIIG